MTWVTISGAGTTTATKFFGDAMNKISNMLNGADVTDTVTINSAVVWTFENGAFKLRNPADTFSYLFTPAAIAADRTITLPLLTGDDTAVTEAFGQPLTTKTIDADNNTITNIGLSEAKVELKEETIAIAASDETTVLGAASTSVPLATFHMPYAFTLTGIRAGLTTAGTGAALITVDVHEAGTTIMATTKITIDATEKTSATAATAAVISDASLAADSLIEVFLDLRDTDNVATGLKVYLIGHRT